MKQRSQYPARWSRPASVRAAALLFCVVLAAGCFSLARPVLAVAGEAAGRAEILQEATHLVAGRAVLPSSIVLPRGRVQAPRVEAERLRDFSLAPSSLTSRPMEDVLALRRLVAALPRSLSQPRYCVFHVYRI